MGDVIDGLVEGEGDRAAKHVGGLLLAEPKKPADVFDRLELTDRVAGSRGNEAIGRCERGEFVGELAGRLDAEESAGSAQGITELIGIGGVVNGRPVAAALDSYNLTRFDTNASNRSGNGPCPKLRIRARPSPSAMLRSIAAAISDSPSSK